VQIARKSKKKVCIDFRDVRIFTNNESVVSTPKPTMPTSNGSTSANKQPSGKCVDVANVNDQTGIDAVF